MSGRVNKITGNARLLRLAALLSIADEKHLAEEQPFYSQRKWTHACGTPACALSHYAAAIPERWCLRPGLWPSLLGNEPLLNKGSTAASLADARKEFALMFGEATELFDAEGCGGAKTAKEAALYILQFVARRQVK